MSQFLIVYDRDAAELLKIEEFGNGRAAALAARINAESEYRPLGRVIEVVVLGAQSLEDLKRTHSRYFTSPKGMLETSSATR